MPDAKTIAQRFIEAAFGRFDVPAVAALVADDLRAHPFASAGRPADASAVRQLVGWMARVFSRPSVRVDDVIAEGDRVVLRYVFEADHVGELGGVAPTGRRVKVPGILIARVRDGRLVEYWREEDALGLMKQLGAA